MKRKPQRKTLAARQVGIAAVAALMPKGTKIKGLRDVPHFLRERMRHIAASRVAAVQKQQAAADLEHAEKVLGIG